MNTQTKELLSDVASCIKKHEALATETVMRETQFCSSDYGIGFNDGYNAGLIDFLRVLQQARVKKALFFGDAHEHL